MSESTHKDIIKIPSMNEKTAHTIELKFSICMMLVNEADRKLLKSGMKKTKEEREEKEFQTLQTEAADEKASILED